MKIRKLLFILFFVVLPIFILHNLIVPFSNIPSGTDPAVMVWGLYHVNESLKHGKNPFITDMVYYPVGANLTHHTLASGFFPVTFLSDKVTGGDKQYPFYAYHGVILLSFILLPVFSFLVLTELGFSCTESFIPSVSYGYCSFFLANSAILNLISSFFLPASAFFLLKFHNAPSWKGGVFLGLFMGCIVYFTEFSFFICLTTAIFTIVLYTVDRDFKIFIKNLKISHILGFMIAFVAIISPFVYSFLSSHVTKAIYQENFAYSSRLADIFIPNRFTASLYGMFFENAFHLVPEGFTRSESFIGFPLLLTACVGFLKMKTKRLIIPGVFCIGFFVLSLGPQLQTGYSAFDAVFMDVRLPYYYVSKLPLLNEFRTPVRFIVFGMFFLMIISAHGISSFMKGISLRWGRNTVSCIMFLLIVWSVAEAFNKPTPKTERFYYPEKLSSLVEGPVINLPIMMKDGHAALYQVFHGQPIATGLSARLSDPMTKHIREMRRLFEDLPDDWCDIVMKMGFRNIVMSARTPQRVADAVYACGLNVIDLRNT